MRARALPKQALLVLLVVLALAGCSSATPAVSHSASASPAKAAATILALGDSTVWDHDCSDCSHSYPHQVQAALAKRTGERIGLIDATQRNGLTSQSLLAEITADAWDGSTEDVAAPAPTKAIAAADIVTITLGANDAPWQQDEDPLCDGHWAKRSCIDAIVTPSLKALGDVLDAIHRIRAGRPTAIRVTTFYNELISSDEFTADRPAAWIAKGLTDARVFSEALNPGICATAKAHDAVCIDLYRAMNGPDGRKALPSNWFVWYGHPRGYDQTFTAAAIMKSGFAPLSVG